jgi:hypothetical protein
VYEKRHQRRSSRADRRQLLRNRIPVCRCKRRQGWPDRDAAEVQIDQAGEGRKLECRRIFEGNAKAFFTQAQPASACLRLVMSRATTEAPTSLPALF